MRGSESRAAWVALILVLSAIGAFHIATIRDGMWLGSDASMYISHARNLVEGVPYQETGYLLNPTKPDHSPAAYPPVFPLMLAPVYAVFGLDVAAMKVEGVLLFLTFLFLVFALFRKDLGAWPALTVAGVLGLTPYFSTLKDDILADIPFLAFVFAAFLVIRRFHSSGGSLRQRILRGSAAGLAIYLAYGTRTIGALLIPSLVIVDIVRARRVAAFTMAALLVAGVLAVTQKMLIPGVGTYLDRDYSISAIMWHSAAYPRFLAGFWFGAFPSHLRDLALAVLGVLAAVGWTRRVRREVGVFEVFVPLYLVTVLLYPGTAGVRYLLPITPFFLYYGLLAAVALPVPVRRWQTGVAQGCIAAALLSSSVLVLSGREFGPLPGGYDRPETVSLISFLERHTTGGDVFLSVNPRILGLLARRKASIYDARLSDAAQWGYMARIGATHVVASHRIREDSRYLYPFIERHSGCFEHPFANGQFDVFKIRAYPDSGCHDAGTRPAGR
jgi:hypothetical protein